MPDVPELEGRAPSAATLVETLYAELRALAACYMRGQSVSHTLQPTALVNEAFLKLARSNPESFNDRAHFMAVAATAMRQVLVNHAEMRNTVKRGGGRSQRSIDHTIAAPDLGVDAIEVLAIEQALRKLSQLDERKARVVEAKIFGGLRHEELAIVLGVSLSTVEGDWRLAKAWLARELRERTEIGPEARRDGA